AGPEVEVAAVAAEEDGTVRAVVTGGDVAGHVPDIGRHRLMLPGDFSGREVERNHRVRGVGAGVRRVLAGGDEDAIALAVMERDGPDRRARRSALFHAKRVDLAVVSRLRHGVVFPRMLAVGRVERDDRAVAGAAFRARVHARGDPGGGQRHDDLVAGEDDAAADRPAGAVLRLAGGFPDKLAGCGVDDVDVTADGEGKNLAAANFADGRRIARASIIGPFRTAR